jgi:hypothetical protein
MTYELELRLIDMLLRMGFCREYITWTLLNCERGMSIGQAMCDAREQITKSKDFPG